MGLGRGAQCEVEGGGGRFCGDSVLCVYGVYGVYGGDEGRG